MTHRFATKPLADDPDDIAPDGSAVRVLLNLESGSMAHFTLTPGAVSTAVSHRSVSELWYILAGSGEMWRRLGDQEAVVELRPGVSLSIPVGTTFQFRSTGTEPLEALGQTMPPWPGTDEALIAEGIWTPTVGG